MSAENVDSLHDLVRKLNYRNRKHLQAYLQVLASQATRCTPAERFVIGRLIGLDKVVEARQSLLAG